VRKSSEKEGLLLFSGKKEEEKELLITFCKK